VAFPHFRIYQIVGFLSAQQAQYLLRCPVAHVPHALLSKARRVWCQHHVVQLEEGVVAGTENVERGTPIRFLRSAATGAASSTIGPRATLTMNAAGFIKSIRS
jgi:hypothetical protein